MKVINLINIIDEGKNIPLEIKVNRDIYKWDEIGYFYSMNDGSDLLELSKEYTTREFLQMEVKIIQIEYEEINVDSIEKLDNTTMNKLIKSVKRLNKKI